MTKLHDSVLPVPDTATLGVGNPPTPNLTFAQRLRFGPRHRRGVDCEPGDTGSPIVRVATLPGRSGNRRTNTNKRWIVKTIDALTEDRVLAAQVAKIYAAARKSANGQSCMVSPHPDLNAKIKAEIAAIRSKRTGVCPGWRARATRRRLV